MIHIGVIGYGYWGPNIVRNLMTLPNATISWVCDVRDRAFTSLPHHYPTIHTTKHVTDVLKDPKTDAVVIATPPSSHFALATQALLANKHVLVEKPMTLTTKDAKTLIQLAHAKKKTLMVDHTFLYTPAIQKLKEILTKHTLGDVYYVESVRTNLGLFQKDSNVVSDLAVHDFSIMEYLFNVTPTRMNATGITQKDIHQETVAHINAWYGKKLYFHSHVSWLSPIKIRRMILVGTKKMAVYDDMEPSEKIRIYDKSVTVAHDLRVGYRSGNVIIPSLKTSEALLGVVEEFIHAIKTGKSPRTDGRQGSLVVACMQAANTSLRSGGKTVTIQRGGK